jgi:outer membrane protein TolC
MKYILTLILLFCATDSFALTLDEAIEAGLQNHQRIEQFRAGVDQAQAAVGSARAKFLPSVDLGYSYLERDDDPKSLGTQSSTLSLGASLNLFNGLSDYHSYRAAQQRARGADYRLQGTRADIVLATEQAYIEVLRAARSVITATEGVELLERQKRDTQLKYEYGLIARNDLLRIDVELSSAKQALLQANGQRQIARRQLERTIGVQLPAEETLVDLTATSLPQFDPSEAASYRQQLLKNRSELNFLRNELAASKRERRSSKGDYLPRVDLSVAHEEYGDDLSPTSSNADDNLLTLSASWKLFDGFAREKSVAAADARTRAVAAELRDTEAGLILQLETALQNLRIADGQLLEAKTGVTSAEENYRVTENRFQQQQATTVDLLDAQFLLTRARNQEINARYDLYLSAAQLERIVELERR